jgi:hypothetical protein
MQLWECNYQVNAIFPKKPEINYSFLVKDWIWSTSKPSNESIGHYWKTLHKYPIQDESCKLANMENIKDFTDKDGNLKAVLTYL